MKISERKLQIRVVKSLGRVDFLALCDEDGNVLSGQTASRMETSFDGVPTFTVTFLVDGVKTSMPQSDG